MQKSKDAKRFVLTKLNLVIIRQPWNEKKSSEFPLLLKKCLKSEYACKLHFLYFRSWLQETTSREKFSFRCAEAHFNQQ